MPQLRGATHAKVGELGTSALHLKKTMLAVEMRMSKDRSRDGNPTHSRFARFGPRLRLSLRVLIASTCCLAGALALAQSADRSALNGYEAAMKETSVPRQIALLERFLSVPGNGSLATSGLEVLVWDYLQSGAPARAASRATALLAVDPENAIALAALADPGVGSLAGDGRERFRIAARGVAAFAHLRKPVGMRAEEFFRLQTRILATLDGEAGLGYLEQKNYDAAKQYLRQAVTASPNHARYVYGLALSLLQQKPPQNQGYWYLARAVNLSRGMPQGVQIAEFARKQYVDAGGTSNNWDRFLIAAEAPPSAPGVPGQGRTSGDVRWTAPGPPDAQRTPLGGVQRASIAAPNSTAGEARQGPSAAPALSPGREPAPGLRLPPPHKNVFIPRDHPLSLGILIQKARLTSDDRNAIVYALSDLVRHLRQDDEVFVMGFDKDLEFEQDLTRDDKLLEEAIANIKPQSGAALLDAVAFAAGHLDRIAKNRSRVLLVISDGHDAAAHISSAEINGVLGKVRVDCIGLDVDDDDGVNLLQSLASYSGGQTSFVNGPKQFRQATWEFAKSMGIEFPY